MWFDRRKCLLLTHAGTLFTIFEADVTASSLRATQQLVTGLIGRELRREDLPTATFGDLEQQEVAGKESGGSYRRSLGIQMKRLEPLCGYDRQVDLEEATASLIALEVALEGGTAARDGERRRVVAGYNQDDCRASTLPGCGAEDPGITCVG